MKLLTAFSWSGFSPVYPSLLHTDHSAFLVTIIPTCILSLMQHNLIGPPTFKWAEREWNRPFNRLFPLCGNKWSGNKTKSVPCKCGWKTLIWSSLEQKLGQLSRPMPPDGCWSRFFLFSDVGVGLLVCESNSCACWRWQWFTSILCRQSGEAWMETQGP